MKRNHADRIFKSTNSLKVLSFLANNTGSEYSGSEIQKATGISKAGVYLALAELVRCGFVGKIKKGSLFLFNINYDNPSVKQFKVLLNMIWLKPLLSMLEDLSKEIILFGSTSRGEDNPDSDIDLFIVAMDPGRTKEILSKTKSKRKIKAVVITPSEITEFKDRNKEFYNEVSMGITIWEAKE